FVKEYGRYVLIAAGDHRVQNGVGEITERRVRRRPGQIGIQTLAIERLLKALRTLGIEKAAVRNAARERIAPSLGIDGKFVGRDDVPDHVRPAEVDISGIAFV